MRPTHMEGLKFETDVDGISVEITVTGMHLRSWGLTNHEVAGRNPAKRLATGLAFLRLKKDGAKRGERWRVIMDADVRCEKVVG